MIVLKSKDELELMRRAGRIVATVMAELRPKVKPGVTTGELDKWAEAIIRDCGATPSFKNYQPGGAPYPFPGSICASVNDEIVHGIPGSRKLKEGDIFKLDIGANFQGYHADSATTIPVGKISDRTVQLLQVTEDCLAAAIAKARSGNRTGDIIAAIQTVAEAKHFGMVREYTSHGVGSQLHEFGLPGVGTPGQGMMLRPGLTIAIEPMINEGKYETKIKKDGWTVATIDGKLSAHFEHTVAITDGVAEVLTKLN